MSIMTNVKIKYWETSKFQKNSCYKIPFTSSSKTSTTKPRIIQRYRDGKPKEKQVMIYTLFASRGKGGCDWRGHTKTSKD